MSRGARTGALALAALASCATASRAGSPWTFPPAFAASQVVDLHGERGDQALLASVWREPGRFEIAFLDPALQVPIVVARLSGGAFAEERLVDFPMPASDVEALLRDVEALYRSDGFRGEGDGASSRVGRWDVVLTGISGDAGCRFPGRIAMRPVGREHPWIEVRTLDIRCGFR